MQSVRFSAVLLCSLVAALAGCGGGSSGAGTGSTGGSGGSGGSGGGNTFQARPFPGDFFAVPPETESGPNFPGNVVYDASLKEFFFSNAGMNEVEAYSTVDGHRIGAVTVPGPVGLSLSPDGTQLAVGTSTPYIYFVNPAALHVTGQVAVPQAILGPYASGLEPVAPFFMASGPMLIQLAGVFGGTGYLLSYNPTNGAFAVANPPGSLDGMVGLPARSLDGNYLAVIADEQTATDLVVYSAQSQTFISSTPISSGSWDIAANADGSQFASVGNCSSASVGASCITLWNRSLQQQTQYATGERSLAYSRDGKYLYVRDPLDVLALNAQTGLPAGYQGLSIEMLMQIGTLWDTDETNRVYGTTDLGAFVASLAQLQPTAPQIPQFTEGSVVSSIGNPNEGPLSGGTQVQFLPSSISNTGGDGLGSTMEAYFGSTPATNDVVGQYPDLTDPDNILTATTPPAAANGPVTVLLTDANNNAVFLPNAYSYGPHVLRIDPSAAPTSGGVVSSWLWADGLEPYLQNSPTVKIDGKLLRTFLPGGSSTGELAVEFDFPQGQPGWADLTLSLADGTSETTKNMVQFLAQNATLASPAYTSAVYDSTRDRFYLTGADNTIGVFDPETLALVQPMQSSAVSAGAVLGSLALTPDNSKLLASDPTDHCLVVFDLTSNTSTAVNVLLPSDGSAILSGPMPIAAIAGNQAFVVMTPWAQNEVRQIDLSAMTMRVRTDFQNVTGIPVPASTIAANADGSVAILGGAFQPGSTPDVWQYHTATDSFSAAVPGVSSQGSFQTDQGALNSDGTVLAMGEFILDQNLMPHVPVLSVNQPGEFLPGGGGLQYTGPYQVDISDTRSGRPLLTLPGTSALGVNNLAFAIDPTGQKILALVNTTLNYYELAVVPLAVGTVSPTAATPGTAVTIRGNGFVAGTTATIAGKSASCTWMDDQTLQCVVPNVNAGMAPMTLSNPDGQDYSLEAAVDIE